MSKYIKLEDALNCVNGYFLTGIHKAIESLPTIEVSEEVTRPFEYFEGYEDGRKSIEVRFNDEQIQSIVEEVVQSISVPSEDCISREWVKGICENMLDEEMLGHMLGYIEDAPSVVPSREKGEWELASDDDGEYGFCSICGNDADFTHYGKPYHYCPNCGAKMRDGNVEDD